MISDEFDHVLDLLKDPEFIYRTRGDVQSRPKAVDFVVRTINRRADFAASAVRIYSPHRGGRACGLRLAFSSGGQCRMVTAYYSANDKHAFTCYGAENVSMAEALLVGYITSELTDDPIPDTFKP